MLLLLLLLVLIKLRLSWLLVLGIGRLILTCGLLVLGRLLVLLRIMVRIIRLHSTSGERDQGLRGKGTRKDENGKKEPN